MRTQGRAEDVQLLISQDNSGWMLEGNVADELKKDEFNKKLEKLTDAQADVLKLYKLQMAWRLLLLIYKTS